MTSNLEHGDTAYTNLALSAHTDTTYYTDPMGLQAFHILHHDGQGGESLFIDGFHVAKRLGELFPWAYKSLASERISAASVGDSNVFMKQSPPSGYPILNLDPLTMDLYQIRFNNADRSALRLKDTITFYKALHEWIKLLKSPEFELRIKLRPGMLVMFNNWRILHGRSSFTGSRRLTGCYIGMDDFQSRLKILNREPKTDI
jgi:trimethyllysine dioxygenase